MAARRCAMGGLGLAVAVAAIVGAPAVAASEPDLATVLSPADGEVLRHDGPLRVVVRHVRGARIERVEVNGRAVVPRTTRLAAGRVRLVLPVGVGRPLGRNTVAIASRRGRAVDLDAVRIVRARATTGLVNVVTPLTGDREASAPVRVSMRVPHRATTVRLWLNGRAVPESQWERRWHAGRIQLDLTASDGLRHGVNRLRVSAARGARRQTVERGFRVMGSVPLAAPGRDRATHIGTPVVLDGRRSVVAPSTARVAAALAYDWQLVGTPSGSTARLVDGSGTATPTLVTDTAGLYTVSLVVSDGTTRSAPATVRIAATQPGLTPVAVSPSDMTITYGGTSYAPDPGVAGAALHYVAFDRATGAPRGVEGTLPATAASVATYRAVLAQLGGDAIVVSSVSANVPASQAGIDLVTAVGGRSAVTIPGGARWTSLTERLEGYLTSGAGGLTFAFGDYRPFTLFSDNPQPYSNTITVDGTAYTATLPATKALDQGGYQVLRLDPTTLEVVSNTAVPTHTRTGVRSTGFNTTQLSLALSAPGITEDLVFVATIGRVATTPLTTGVIEALGGTPQTLSAMKAGDRYGLVYAPPNADVGATTGSAIEVGDVIDRDPSQALGLGRTAPPVQVSGHLTRRSDGRMEPAAAVAGPDAGIGFAPIVYRPAVPWPGTDTAGGRAALAWIAFQLGIPGDDPRAVYTQKNIDIDNLLTQLTRLTYPGDGNGFVQADFDAAKLALAGAPGTPGEFTAVANVRLTMDEITATFGSTAGLKGFADIGAISLAVQNAVKPPPAKTHFDVLKAMGGGMIAAAKLASGPAATGLSFTGEVLTVAAEFQKGSSAGGDPQEVVSDTATLLQTDVPTRIVGYIDALGGIEDAIVTDHGRLMAAQEQITGGAWVWSNAIAADAQKSFTLGMARESWISLVGTMYTSYRLDPVGGDAGGASGRAPNGSMTCPDGTGSNDTVYKSVPAPVLSSWNQSDIDGPVGRVISRSNVRIGMKTDSYHLDPLPTSLATPLFTPVTGAGSSTPDPMGFYPPHFAASLTQKTMVCAYSKYPYVVKPARVYTRQQPYWVLIQPDASR